MNKVQVRIAGTLVIAISSICSTRVVALGPGVSDPFQPAVGDVFLGPFAGTPNGLNALNWSSGGGWLIPHASSLAFMSANGNSGTDFFNDGIRKNLGGTVSAQSYSVSLWVATYLSLEGVELSDFTSLRVGGPDGQMQWLDTPKPTVNGQWVQWHGIYTPASSDVGGPFAFEAIWNLRARHAIALDGPVVATPVPEPGTAVVGVAAAIVVLGRRSGGSGR